MSLSKLPWNHFGPHHPFPEKQKFHGCYQDVLAPPAFLRPLGLSISAAFAPGPSAMSNSSNMNTLSPDEMQRFQKLSNEFEPDVPVGDSLGVYLREEFDAQEFLQGLLVSPKQSSHNIALEYANADPAFATKTSVSLCLPLVVCILILTVNRHLPSRTR